MTEPLSKIPSGFRYYSACEARARRVIETSAMSIFEGWSYEEIVTPTVDYYSLFEQGMGETEAQRSFRLTDADGHLLALRPDVTATIGRAAATLFAKCDRPLRLCYSATVFHQRSRSSADWRRELTQVGCELLGKNSTAADMEILAIAMEFMRTLQFDRGFVITLGDAEIFGGIVENLGLDTNAQDELRRLVDVRAVWELERFLGVYTSADDASAFADLIQLSGKADIFPRARRVITNTRSRAALDRLESLWRIIESLGWSANFEIDLGDVSRLDYYTGLTFKIYVRGLGSRVGGGGRYDNLTAKFGNTEPAIGFVVELDALAEMLAKKAKSDLSAQHDRVLVSSGGDDICALFREATELRAANRNVRIDGENASWPS
ncbi:MAG: ATP phosphoribosyltransferase regulatory subunit [Pyrinomonadaceae bacterium]